MTALTCLWSRVTRSTRAAIGWVAKQLSGCKPDRLGPVSLPTTGRLPIGSRSITAIPILAVSARLWSMCLELRLRSLVLALGKDSNAYLVDRNNLGGITSPVAQANVSGTNRGTSAVTYHTSQGTYFAFHNESNAIRAYKITPTNPPTITFAWSMSQTGRGSPWVTTTDGTNNVIVWVAGVQGDQRLHGYDGDTGAVIYAGGGTNELMTGTQQWNTGIAARGRILLRCRTTKSMRSCCQPGLLRLHLLLVQRPPQHLRLPRPLQLLLRPLQLQLQLRLPPRLQRPRLLQLLRRVQRRLQLPAPRLRLLRRLQPGQRLLRDRT